MADLPAALSVCGIPACPFDWFWLPNLSAALR